MTVVALVAMLLAYRLPFSAGGAEELSMQRVTTRYQTAQHTSTAVGERGTFSAPREVVVQWSIRLLTFEWLLISHTGGSMLSGSLHSHTQAQRESALHHPHTMRDTSLHAAALHSPVLSLSFMTWVQ